MNKLFVTLLLVSFLSLPAVEQQLQLGPDVYTIRGGIYSQHIDKGGQRSEKATLHALAGIRYMNIGLQGEGWLALQDDDDRNVDAGDNTEIRLRLDYLLEEESYFQILPFLETSFYPSLPSDVEEPMWLGVDAWYLLPWEGVEAGGSLQFDLDDNYGVYGSFAMREFYQNSPFDLMAWQALNWGDGDFHEAWTGSDDFGLTTLELGVEVTLPMPWENTWVSLSGEGHIWLMDEDRDRLEDDSHLVFGLSVWYSDRLR